MNFKPFIDYLPEERKTEFVIYVLVIMFLSFIVGYLVRKVKEQSKWTHKNK